MFFSGTIIIYLSIYLSAICQRQTGFCLGCRDGADIYMPAFYSSSHGG
jgi:hypothetical protein